MIEKRNLIKSNTKNVDSIILESIPESDSDGIWLTHHKLYKITQDKESVIVLDLKQMQNLARKFDSIIKKEYSK